MYRIGGRLRSDDASCHGADVGIPPLQYWFLTCGRNPAFGSPELIKALNDVKFSFNSYTMNAYSLICGVAAMEDEDYFNAGVSKIINTRETAKSKLKELGFSFPDSKANFIFAKHESVPAKVIFDKLKQRGIYVRYFNKEKIDNYLRISIGTDEQMEKLYAALKEIIKEEK